MFFPFSVHVPTFALGEGQKNGIAVEDRRIAESLRLHPSMIKQPGRGKSVDLRRPAWPNPKLTETLRFLNFFHRLKRLFLTNLISAILHCKVLPLLASS
ncbi:hypothetical protein PIB30_080323 [Stylosanthes scabra]|uniref:Uncharacterized protein n=1 Tax=Stylosanthes scabra TaxID=79078 RepID=A0ABU6VR09_9FABA|nr:hypothetical protein [Stylosanthes scabra]